MAFKFFNIGKANAEIDAADSVLNPALAKANILSISVDGKAVPANDAPLAAKISAIFAANPVGEGQQNVSELLVTNADLARQLEKLTSDHAAATATVAGLGREKSALEARAASAEGSVQTMTAEKSQLQVQLKAAQDEFSRVNGQLQQFNTELSRVCLAAGCLELTEADGRLLPKEATAEQKQAAAERIPALDKIKAYAGAVNAALARTGINVNTLPNASGSAVAANGNVAHASILAKLEAIKDPTERARFHKANASAIFAAMKALQN